MGDGWVLIDTSSRTSRVGVARGGAVVQSATLDPTRRHARDLAETIRTLLAAEGLTPRGVANVAVGVGPGGYTGLRVGLATAKAFAYAVGCGLMPVPTFAAIAENTPTEFDAVDVVADALQGLVYVQRFRRVADGWTAVNELSIRPASEWAAEADVAVTGPGMAVVEKLLGDVPRVPTAFREPSVESMWRAARGRAAATREEMFRLEPLYLRGSSAEEKAKQQ